ncbi:MAG: hypothetical protein D3908_03990, partial [Candidatus Electrothrix sp. AUS4]|nr:hypothetical protein [Candidatus Electrothrix sp. AUS4]
MRILHISEDSQFTQFISKRFEMAAPKANDYVIICKKRIRYKINEGKIYIIAPKIWAFLYVILVSRKYDILLAHGLNKISIFLFLFCRKKIKVWSGWGFDYYNNNDLCLYDKHTKDIFLKKERKIYNIYKVFSIKIIEKVVAEIQYFSAPIPTDFSVMKKKYSNFSGKYIQLNYGSLEETFFSGGDKITHP